MFWKMTRGNNDYNTYLQGRTDGQTDGQTDGGEGKGRCCTIKFRWLFIFRIFFKSLKLQQDE